MKFLVVEDEHNIANYLNKGLTEAGYTIDIAYDGEEALKLLSDNKYDLILMDVMLPKINGIEVCETIRGRGDSTYILLISAKDKIEDKVKGLNAGADDYLAKPFDFTELLARIRAILRRNSSEKESVLYAKDLELNLLNREVTRNSIPIELTVKEFNLLEYFLRNKNLVLTRTMIAQKVWNIDFLTDTNIVDVYINHLRKKVDKGYSDKLIHTVRGVGYILKV
jgi:DNA-binding response OmpR family regulator